MNINLITPNICIRPNSKQQNQQVQNYVTATAPLRPLKTDTISFGINVNKIGHHVEAGYQSDLPRLERIATTFLYVLNGIATKLAGKYSFDLAYCDPHKVKSAASYANKVQRSCTFDVRDKVRATLYCRDLGDLKLLFNELLPELKLCGYVVADAPMKIKDLMKRGYIPTESELKDINKTKMVPDLDIRTKVSPDQIAIIPPEYRYSVGHPQSSGYQDIQLRLKRDFVDDKKKAPVLHELIIVFGRATSEAKTLESERIYGNLRLFNELHMKFEDDRIGSSSAKAKRYRELIETMMRGKVSEKLFANAENVDVYGMNPSLKISFSKEDQTYLSNYFTGLKKHLRYLYKDAEKKNGISDAEVRQLRKDYREDKAIVDTIEEKLKEVVEYYINIEREAAEGVSDTAKVSAKKAKANKTEDSTNPKP